ncbi:transcriptional regulator, TetR family [Rhodobacter ferrooxidans]|uniref:Transcriptional regulator, TetR family n=2 Tax=Rhodobacter ferrooxidans TaxID=371731 RepID=C8S5G3_9RHOB|nr:transcriptional regulator, TetR family [Rhodobacter sp. SW2]
MRKSADLRKSEIIACALTLADRLGPDRVTTGAVAQAVGVTQAAIFRHFPSKAALWQAIAALVSERLAQAWDAALAQADTPLGRVTALVSAQLAQIEAMPAMPMLLFSRELNVKNAELRAMFRGRLAAFHGHLLVQIRDGQAAGLIRADLAPQDGAVLLTSLVQGLAIRWALGARDFPLAAEGRRLLAAQLALFGVPAEQRGE